MRERTGMRMGGGGPERVGAVRRGIDSGTNNPLVRSRTQSIRRPRRAAYKRASGGARQLELRRRKARWDWKC